MDQRRQYSRVDARIPLHVRPLSAEEGRNVQARLGKPSGAPALPPPPEVADPKLNDWLKMINAKVDALLAQHAGIAHPPSLKPQYVNLSAGGIRVTLPDEHAIGDLLEIQMELPTQRPLYITTPAAVVRVVREKDGFATSACFINIDESVRQKVAGYVFLRERELIMQKRQ